MLKTWWMQTLEERNWKTLDVLSFVSTGRHTKQNKTPESLYTLEECTSGCSDASSKQQSRTFITNSHTITSKTGVYPRTYPQDQVRIKGKQTVALVFQKRSTAHH